MSSRSGIKCMKDFTDAELAEMACDALYAIVDGFPDASALAWARLDDAYTADTLTAMADAAATLGVGDKAAVEYSSRAIVLTAERDGLKLKGLGAVAGLPIGLLAPGGREASRNLLKRLPK